jgi:ATP-dependent helicase/nuclease subunit A
VTKTRFEPPDQAQRERIATDLDHTLLVEAAAGTGKTTCLVARMVGLLRTGKCRVETLVAVTFTRKAAAELRTRFQLSLEKEVGNAKNDERQRLINALGQIERCFVGTIHSFCARLLRERPVEAGVNPGFIELDEELDSQLRQQAWREHVATLITTGDPILPELEKLGLKVSPSTRRNLSLVTELNELGLEPAELGPAFMSYAEYADVEEWPAKSVPLPDLKPCIQALEDYVRHISSLSLPADPGNDKLIPKYGMLKRMASSLDLHNPAELMEVLEQFSELDHKKVVQKNWPGKKAQAISELASWNDFAIRYAVPLVQTWREHRYEPVMRIIRQARDLYDALRRARNGLNFQDLLLRSAKLLRDKPEVRRYFRERFTHLLVDEFQDTDPIQAEVMLLLTADNSQETDWQLCNPVDGALFVVGDPKQSIYRFRRADIVTYSKVRSIIERAGGEVIPLSANFRSVKLIVDWVNRCFAPVFPAQADAYQPANRPLDVGRSKGNLRTSVVERLQSPADLTRNDQVAEHEADLIARTIRRAIDEKWPLPRTEGELEHGLPEHVVAGDFLIVARYKPRLTQYARKLQQYGVPHSVTGGHVLNEVPELELLHTCLNAVTRSDDPIALVAVLRSELFGVADTVLYDFRRRGGRFSYNTEIPEGLPSGDAEVLRDAFQRLRTYAGWLRKLPTVAAFERVAGDLGLIARACASEEGDAHAGSLLKAFELLRSCPGDLAGDCVEALSRLVDHAEQHDGITVRPSVDAPVRLMNLHQCKGLEAPFVFLVDPAGENQHDVSVHIDRSGSRPRGYLAVYGPRRSEYGPLPVLAHPPDWRMWADEEEQFLQAEAKRLLYVAATRAGVKLVISQRDGTKNNRNPWQLFDRELQQAKPFAEPGAVETRETSTVSIDADDWKREVDSIEDRWRGVMQPTYAVQAIKESAIKVGTKPHGEMKNGAGWGELLHGLLEAAIKQPAGDLRGLALSTLENLELPASLIDEAIQAVAQVIASPLWQRALAAERSLAEVPIAYLLAAHESNSGLPTVLRGVIDLVFKEDRGWVIVDYKSERVDASEIPALVKYYRPQIEAYAAAWEKVVGQPVIERGLFFTHCGNYVSI